MVEFVLSKKCIFGYMRVGIAVKKIYYTKLTALLKNVDSLKIANSYSILIWGNITIPSL